MTAMLPEQTAIEVDNPEKQRHGDVGFVLYNPRSTIKPCDNCPTGAICDYRSCSGGETLSEGEYRIVFTSEDEPLSYSDECFYRDDLAVRGC